MWLPAPTGHQQESPEHRPGGFATLDSAGVS
jgi:hypothetical protein